MFTLKIFEKFRMLFTNLFVYLQILFMIILIKMGSSTHDRYDIQYLLDAKKNCKLFIKSAESFRIFSVSTKPSFQINFYNFNDYTQIDFKCLNNLQYSIDLLIFQPNRPIILNNNLNLDLRSHLENQIDLRFIFSKGIESDLNIFEIFYQKNHKVYIKFYYSSFGFESEKNKVCFPTKSKIFKNIFSLYYTLSSKYIPRTCPMIFYHCNISHLTMKGISNTIIKNNNLTFRHIDTYLNSFIQYLNLYIYQSKIDQYTLYYNVFSKLEYLNLYGKLIQIDPETFKNLTKIKKIQFFLDNVNMFITQSFEWLKYMNQNVTINSPSLSILINYYDFPDSDLCIFERFPRNRKILIDFYGSNCTCTVFWLYNIYFHDDGLKKLMNNCQNYFRLNLTCNFDFKFCFKQLKKKDNLTNIDFFYLSEYINFFTFLFFPFIALIGLLANLVSIFILLSVPNVLSFDQFLIKLMIFNSALNCFYCLIYFFHVANICIGLNGIICPFLSKSTLVQHYEVYIVDFFGGIIKTLSNSVSFFISFGRFVSLRNDFFLKFYKSLTWQKNYVFGIVIIIAVFINIDKLMTSIINTKNFIGDSYTTYEESPKRHTFVSSFEYESYQMETRFLVKTKKKRWFYFFLFSINFFINDVLLCILLLASDILLLKRFKEDIKKKEAFNILKVKKNKSTNIRITTTILISINSLLILRFLELGLNFLVFKFKIKKSACDDINKICTNIYQASNFCFLISCSYTTFIYYFLNKQFRNKIIYLVKKFKNFDQLFTMKK